MDIIKLARDAGLTVVTDGVIGRQQYQSVTGPVSALRRFGDAYTRAPDQADDDIARQLKNRAALQFEDCDAALMRAAAERIIALSREIYALKQSGQ
ncbi:hypothetical protein BM43_3169 [Burkholderia gladioli]|uniref:hypothetical protein n=1 Tax=Burkholderia gladioli TaxID=28095 RepID=UPI0005A678C2|nr:hypothetical protein [Burkholderia gladioli]AJX00339.1 hypothetical protein BM43_3169 [Burkholderia gladioli]ASD79125.1 hypothetical protein CEJ98_08975 [Burkholderia gladioli pv. gladioli]AWY55633.1 hypothetical protein A8H28_32185 [Burkholderia gladioli pv. gladioli]SPV21782.1 Uncharacterised protein [Burkholderia gladioli]